MVEGTATTGFAFRHADGSAYGAGAVSPRAAEARAKAFRALTVMGFRQSEARLAVDRAHTHVGPLATTEVILRRALAELTPARSR